MFKKVHTFLALILSILFILILPGSITAVQSSSLSAELYGGPPLTDSFTYQGYFEYSGNPANGNFDFRVTIWDLETLGTEIASCQVFDNIFVQDGLFTFHLLPDTLMDQVFNGEPRWLQVAVRQSGTTTWTTLPRQPITAVPYAWSLRPGADIEGATSDYTLSLANSGSSGALYASSSRVTGVTISAEHTTDGYAVLGSTNGGYPAVGGHNGGGGSGLYGFSETGHGIWGYTDTDQASGVVGVQTGYSSSDLSDGWYRPGGLFGGRNGVVGITKTDTGYGVFGISKAVSGYAGYFLSDLANGVAISSPSGTTGLAVYGGTKNAVVDTDQGSALLYTEESTEVWFTDYGFGSIEDDSITIVIDPLFAQTVNLEEPYHVFIQPYGDASIYVTNRTSNSFEVHLSDGTLPIEFSYRIVAKRLGYETDRLEPAQNISLESSEVIRQPLFEGVSP
jgi:hypothetical protein